MNRAQLEADVCQSQAIEYIPYAVDSKLSQAHLEATQITWDEVSVGRWPSVRALHGIMMRPSDLDLPCVGAWRSWSVYVGGDVKPGAFHVPELMEEWEHMCHKILHAPEGQFDTDARVTLADLCYYHFECVHPFADGNGRTGRLMRNALRVLLGLPWDTITVDMHPLYVRHLVKYEDETFRPPRINLYPKE